MKSYQSLQSDITLTSLGEDHAAGSPQNGHPILALLQLGAAFGYLLYVLRFYHRIAPLIAETRQEWRDDAAV